MTGGGGADNAKHNDGRTEEVIGRRDGGVGEDAYWADSLHRPSKKELRLAVRTGPKHFRIIIPFG